MFQFQELRQQLHQIPEVSGEEWQTSQFLKNYLAQFSPTSLVELAGAGFAAIFEGKGEGKTVLIRAELDALPIQELNDFSYKSLKAGVSHKCGHDGHMAILCGIAHKLNEQALENGTAVLLFQPAEETGKGAKAVLEHESFKLLPQPDFVFALHNIPKRAKNAIWLKNGVFTASVKSWAVKLMGKTAHAASPEHGINPAMAISELIQKTRGLVQNDASRKDYQLITPIHINMGEIAYGIAAGEGEAHFTVRTWKNDQMDLLTASLEKIANQIAQKYSLEISWEWLEEFYANENDPIAADWIRNVASQHQLEVKEMDIPFKFGEDFGLFTTRFKGAMFGLGAGLDIPELHNPDYDFPDEIAPAGMQMFESLIRLVTQSE